MAEVEGIRYCRIFWTSQTGKGVRVGNAVKDPPTNGWSTAFLMEGEKSVTVFCPWTFTSYRLPKLCFELLDNPELPLFPEKHGAMIRERWERFHGYGFDRDYDMAAVVLTKLGQEVPQYGPRELRPGEEPKTPRSSGKAVVTEALKPIKPNGRRADVTRFFLVEGHASIREAMAKLDMTRSGVLSHLFCINRDHGLGYELTGDGARLVVPEGWDVFAGATGSTKGGRKKKNG